MSSHLRATQRQQPVRSFETCEQRMLLAVDLYVNQLSPTDYLGNVEAAIEWAHREASLTGSGQTVAVIDSGIAYDHIAFEGDFGASSQVVGGWDFTTENDADPYDDGPTGFHGTHVAGILASRDANHLGVAPNVDLVALRVFDDYGQSDFRWIESALQWVHDHQHDFEHPITTVNLSVGIGADGVLSDEEKILDDELAMLEQDGIFVAIAAGNGFNVTPTPGVSYPASSGYGFPVGSTDPHGQLSEFSRRDDGVLVAPGERINSATTDFIFDFNGKSDDWMEFSGTSQATPIVAGAAVLVREAFQRAGQSNVTPDQIYDVLAKTASAIKADSGETLYRMNLQAALEAILPQDRKATDVDETEVESDETSAGEISKDDVEGAVDVRDLAAEARSLGRIDFLQSRVDLSEARTWSLEATQSGTLTIDARFGPRRDIDLQVRRADGEHLASSTTGGGNERVDLHVEAGQQYVIEFTGAEAAGQLTIANLLSGVDDKFNLTLPKSVPSVRIVDTDQLGVELGTLSYAFDTGVSLHLELTGQAVQFTTENSSNLNLRNDSAEILSGATRTTFAGSSKVMLNATPGTDSQAQVYGDAGNQILVSNSVAQLYRGARIHYRTEGFDRIYVYSEGGADRAELRGGTGDDLFVGREHNARLSDEQRQVFVEGFHEVVALAGAGGDDRAFLYGSTGDDTLSSRGDSSRLVANETTNRAESFDRVYAIAVEGGLDRAYLFGTEQRETLSASRHETTLESPSLLRTVQQFDRVYSYSTPGSLDEAFLNGTEGRETLLANLDEFVLGSSQFHLQVDGYDQVRIDGGGGFDVARLVVPDSRTNEIELQLGADWIDGFGTTRWRANQFELLNSSARSKLRAIDLAVAQRAYAVATDDFQLELSPSLDLLQLFDADFTPNV